MDKAKIRAAMKAVTAGLGRKATGATGDAAGKVRTRLTDALTAGSRTTAKGKVIAFNGAATVNMAARLLIAGGTVPEVVRTRFAFALAVPAIREMAESLGCEGDALVAALVAPVEVAPEVAPEAAPEVVAEAEHAPVARIVGGPRRR